MARKKGRVFDPFRVAAKKRRLVFWRKCEIDEQCPICLSQMKGKSVTVYPCGHCVHSQCDKGLRESNCLTKHKCLMCREKLPRSDEEDVAASIHVLLELTALDVDVILERLAYLASSGHLANASRLQDASADDTYSI